MIAQNLREQDLQRADGQDLPGDHQAGGPRGQDQYLGLQLEWRHAAAANGGLFANSAATCATCGSAASASRVMSQSLMKIDTCLCDWARGH